MLLALGSNGSGQLGIGHEDDVCSPSRCTPESSFGAAHHLRIAAGGNHTLLLLRPKSHLHINPLTFLYASGDNTDGRCGRNPPRLNTFWRAEIDSDVGTPLYDIKFISATWEASIFVTSDNQVFSQGTGLKGELGLGQDVTQSTASELIPGFPPHGLRVVDIASSMGHTVAVLSNGAVYGWGQGRKGQLGEPRETCWAPRKISEVDFKAAKAVCGKEFTYVVGSPESGSHIILGSDKWSVQSAAPNKVAGWKSIGASWNGIYVLLGSSELIGWGRNDHKQLPPENLPLIDDFAAGSEHVIAKTRSGKLLAWGWGEHGNCGKPTTAGGDVRDGWNEIEVKGRVLAIGAGCATSWIHTAES